MLLFVYIFVYKVPRFVDKYKLLYNKFIEIWLKNMHSHTFYDL